MSEFNADLYKVKGIFLQDETEPIITGFYYQDEHGRHFIISDEDFKHYETNVYTLCRNTGIKIADTYLYEYDIVSYFEPMRDKKQYGFIDFDEFYKCFIVRTGIECRATRLLRDCSKIEFANRNIVLNEVDFNWFAEWDYKDKQAAFEEAKSYIFEYMKHLSDELQPTADVVEVVRCKDCGSYNKHYGECTLNGSHFGENGYCCRGTRTPKERGADNG